VKQKYFLAVLIALLIPIGAADNHIQVAVGETDITSKVDTSTDNSVVEDAMDQIGDVRDSIFGSESDEAASRTDLILEAKVDATELSQEEVAAVSGVPPLSVNYPKMTVKEVIDEARSKRKATNWNKYANQAVASMGTYETSSGTIEVESPAEVSINGNSFVVSSDGYVFTEGQGWAAPQCWEDLNYQPPKFDKSLVPQVDPGLSTTSSGEECPSWVSQENLEWLPTGDELARPETYCTDITGKPTTVELENRPSVQSTDKLERIYYEGGENAVVETECVENKLVPMCGKGDPNNYCKKMNIKLCDYFDSNCGKAEDVSVENQRIWMEACSADTNTTTFEGKKTCITEEIGPKCTGENNSGDNCERTMRSLCSYLGLGYSSEDNLCTVRSG
jgi:hypothetical protein